MTESPERAHFETLQVSPVAEPEVIAAAYRALARKYHPDRSSAPDAMTRMARINAAFQAVSGGRSGRIATGDKRPDPPLNFPSRLAPERIDPKAPLEQTLATTARMVTAARQRVIDELAGDGIAHDIATTLVATALKGLMAGGADSRKEPARATGTRFDPDASYDEVLKEVMERARTVRDGLADQLVRDGLDRGAAVEVADESFDRVRRKTRVSGGTDMRFTSARVDLTGSLDHGVQIVTEKLRAARQLVVEELTRDGIPLRTADQLVEAASTKLVGSSRR